MKLTSFATTLLICFAGMNANADDQLAFADDQNTMALAQTDAPAQGQIQGTNAGGENQMTIIDSGGNLKIIEQKRSTLRPTTPGSPAPQAGAPTPEQAPSQPPSGTAPTTGAGQQPRQMMPAMPPAQVTPPTGQPLPGVPSPAPSQPSSGAMTSELSPSQAPVTPPSGQALPPSVPSMDPSQANVAPPAAPAAPMPAPMNPAFGQSPTDVPLPVQTQPAPATGAP